MEEYSTIENTPEPKNGKCKAIVLLITICLYALPFILGLYGWFNYEWFIAFGLFCFGYILNGIIHSKLRQISIPPDQLERSFSSYEVASWFVSKYINFCIKIY